MKYFMKDLNLSNTDKMLLHDVNAYLPNDLLVKMDRMSMANSLEARSPFLDHKISEFVSKLPPELKRKGNEGKIILKNAFNDFIPANILNRTKQGFGVPLDKWFRSDLEEMLKDNLLSNTFKNRGYFSAEKISNLIELRICLPIKADIILIPGKETMQVNK